MQCRRPSAAEQRRRALSRVCGRAAPQGARWDKSPHPPLPSPDVGVVQRQAAAHCPGVCRPPAAITWQEGHNRARGRRMQQCASDEDTWGAPCDEPPDGSGHLHPGCHRLDDVHHVRRRRVEVVRLRVVGRCGEVKGRPCKGGAGRGGGQRRERQADRRFIGTCC